MATPATDSDLDLFAELDASDLSARDVAGGKAGITRPIVLPDPAAPATEIIDPFEGQFVRVSDADSLAEAIIRIREYKDQLYTFERLTKDAIVRLTDPNATTKTRRVRGERHRIKVEMPGTSWDQSKLKEAYHAFPQHRDSCLGISSLAVKLREFNKIRNETGPADFETFKAMVLAAEREPTASPTITVEE